MLRTISSFRMARPVEVLWAAVRISVMLSVRDFHPLIELRDLEILPQRMPGIIIREQDAAQAGMTGEDDADHVEGLAFVPEGCRPAPRHRGNRRTGHWNL